jgi:D-alanyl-D-alanine dipeptidase
LEVTHLILTLLLSAAPPKEPLVDAAKLIPNLVVDLRYATEDNFLKARVYPETARCLLLESAAKRLAAAAKALETKKLRLKVWDCYRPLSVQFEMWKVFPKRGYVADPNKGGSHHNRGAAVDLTLVTADGKEVEMPTGFDSFTRAAHHWYTGGTPASLEHRALLREVMEGAGFNRNPMEWWHYDLPESITYPARDDPFT